MLETDSDFVEIELNLAGVDLFPVFENAVATSSQPTKTVTHIWFPAHIRCAAHTLKLLATTDVDAIVETFPILLKQLYTISMKNTNDIWNKSNRSIKSAELCEQVIGRQLQTPCETRWNSSYDALKVLLAVDHIKLRTLCEKIQVISIHFSPNELAIKLLCT